MAVPVGLERAGTFETWTAEEGFSADRAEGAAGTEISLPQERASQVWRTEDWSMKFCTARWLANSITRAGFETKKCFAK